MSNLSALLLLMLTAIGSIGGELHDGNRAGCYEHFPETNTWYKLHRMPLTFQEAAFRCSLEGAILASPLSTNHKLAMTSMMKSHEVNGAIFTGIHATFSPGEFVSLEGISIDKIMTAWAPDEPDNKYGNEHCIVMSPEGDMADKQCDGKFSYLCERSDNTFHICGTHDQGYDYDHRTNSCYKFHTAAADWRQAFKICQAEGSHLAIVNDILEAKVLKDLYAKYPETAIRPSGNYFGGVALIGFHDQFSEGYFMTVHGETLEKAGFAEFSDGQPNNLEQGQDCGSINRNDGLLNDFWCDGRAAAFICEKSPIGNSCDEGAFSLP